MHNVLFHYLIKDDFISFCVSFLFCNNYFVNGCVGVFSSERYLEPMPLPVKSYHFELIKTVEHNNTDFNYVNYIRLTGIIAACSVL